MRRRWKLAIVAALGLTGLGTMAWLAAPVVVRWQVQKSLHLAGYPAASINRMTLGFSSADLFGVVLDPQRDLTVARIHVLWRWRDLLGGRLRRVDLDGLELALDLGPQGVDLKPLAPQPTSNPSVPSGEIPVERLVLIGGHLRLRHGAREERWAVSGVLVDAGGGNGLIQGHATGETGSADVRGTVPILGTGIPDIRLDLSEIALDRLGRLSGREDLPPAVLAGTLRWDGSATADLTVASASGPARIHARWQDGQGASGTLDAPGTDLAALVTVAGPWLPPLPVGQPAGKITAQLAWTWRPGFWSMAGPVSLGDASATTALGPWTAGRIAWDGRISSSPGGLVPVGTITLDNLRGEVPLLGSATLTSGRISATGGDWAFQGGLLAGNIQATVEGDAATDLTRVDARVLASGVDLAAWSGRFPGLVPVTVQGTGAVRARVSRLVQSWSGTATVEVAGLTLADPGKSWQAGVEALTAEGGFTWMPGTSPVAQAILRIDRGSVSAAGTAITGLTGTFPFSLGEDPGLSGELTGTIAVAGLTVPARLRARLVDQTLKGRGDARLYDLVDASAEGTVAFTTQGVAADLTLAVPRTVISDPLAIRQIHPALAGITATGAMSASGTLHYQGTTLTPRLHLDLRDGAITLEAKKLAVRGLDLGVDIVELQPLRTAPEQEFNAKEVRLNDQVGTRIGGWWGLSDQRLLIRQWGIDWADGRIGSPLTSIDLETKRLTGDACATKIDLGQVAALAVPGLLTGSGRLTGQVPVTFDWAVPHLALGEGLVKADPPEGDLRFSDRARIAAWIGDGGVMDGDLRKRLVDTVQDFRFTRLELATHREATGGLLAQVVLGGRGRTGATPLELGSLTFNIRGLEDGLIQVLRLQGAPASAPAPKDDTLDRFFGP